MTNEQLAMVLVSYFNEMIMLKHSLDEEDYALASIRAAKTKARLDAAIKTLGIEVFISPLS